MVSVLVLVFMLISTTSFVRDVSSAPDHPSFSTAQHSTTIYSPRHQSCPVTITNHYKSYPSIPSCSLPHSIHQAPAAAVARLPEPLAPPPLPPPPALLEPPTPGLASVYLAKALASAFLALTFWLPMKLSTVTAMARSMSCARQYSDSRMRQKASEIRMMASR